MELFPFILRKIRSLKDKGFFYLFLAMGIGQSLSFVQRILLGRWLAQEDFGRYTLIVETTTLFTALITLALPLGMIRFGLKEGKLDYYFAGTFKVFIGLSSLFIGGYFILRTGFDFFDDQRTQQLCDVVILLSPLMAFFNYCVCYLSAGKKISERAVITLLQRVVFFTFLISGCWLALWWGTIAGYFSFIVVFGFGLLVRYRKALLTSTIQFPYKKLISFSSWSSFSTVCSALSFFLILNFSERLLDDLSLISQLMIAFTFTVIAKLFFGSINDLLFPYFMEKGNAGEVRWLLLKSTIFYVMLSAIIIFLSYIIVPILIELLLGDKYQAAIPLFKVVIIGEIIIGFSLLFELLLEVFGAVRFKAITMVIDLLIIVTILTPMLDAFGVFGAAYTFIIFASIRATLCMGGVFHQLKFYNWQEVKNAEL